MVASSALLGGKIEEYRKRTIDEGAPPWRILRYLRIVSPEKKPYPIPLKGYVRPETFESHLKYLKKSATVVPLPELIERIRAGDEIPEGTVALTLDGGFREGLTEAFPLLQKHGVPATFMLPTGYIGTRNFFWQEKIVTTMMIFQSLDLRIPAFSFLDDTFYEQMAAVSAEGLINQQSIGLLVEALSRATPSNRLIALDFIGNMLADVADLPQEDCFLNWNEVRMLIRGGHTVGLHGHGYMWFHEAQPEDIKSDLESALKVLDDEDIPYSEVLAFPDGIITPESSRIAAEMDLRAQLLLGPVPKQQPAAGLPLLLGRVPMFQDASFCTELFACRVWELTISGVTF